MMRQFIANLIKILAAFIVTSVLGSPVVVVAVVVVVFVVVVAAVVVVPIDVDAIPVPAFWSPWGIRSTRKMGATVQNGKRKLWRKSKASFPALPRHVLLKRSAISTANPIKSCFTYVVALKHFQHCQISGQIQ